MQRHFDSGLSWRALAFQASGLQINRAYLRIKASRKDARKSRRSIMGAYDVRRPAPPSGSDRLSGRNGLYLTNMAHGPLTALALHGEPCLLVGSRPFHWDMPKVQIDRFVMPNASEESCL